jgi:gamma-glutamylputrescine oxidase
MPQTSIWEAESFYAPKDIIIVGSGFVGLWSAYYLKKRNPELSIMIVERGSIPTGASTRNAGFACFGSYTELTSDFRTMGEDKTLEMVDMRFRGLRRIRKIFRDREIGYDHSGGYELMDGKSGGNVNQLRSRLDRMNQALKKVVRKEKVFHLQDAKINEFGFSGVQHLIENRLEGQLHPGKLCQSLLALLHAMGVTILNGTEILSYQRINGRVELETQLGVSLQAGRLLICTNAFARQLLPELDLEPARGQILLTSPVTGLKFRGCFHFEEGFYYFRNLDSCVLLGGARNKALEAERSFEMNTSAGIQDELERFLRETVLPGQHFSIAQRWSGIMGVGKEKTPVIGEINDQVFCAVRMSGMGVALAPEVGRKIAQKMVSG